MNNLFVRNYGHFKRRDRLRWLRGRGMQDRCVEFVFLVGHCHFVLASGRLRSSYELFGCAHWGVEVLEHFCPW